MTPVQTEPFIPLTAAIGRSDDAAEHRVHVVSRPGHTETFRPLGTETPAPAGSALPHATKTCDPRVSIQREGDQVTGIRIHCGCGQVIDLACIY